MKALHRLPPLLVAACLLGGGGCRQSPSAPQGTEGVTAEVMGQLQAGDAAGAADTVGRALAVRPRDPTLLRLAGEVALVRERPREAGQRMRAALVHGGDTSKVEMAAEALVDQGAPYEAIRLLEQAIRVAPTRDSLRRKAGRLQAAMGNEWGAVPHFQWLTQHAELDFDAMVVLADWVRPQIQKWIFDRLAEVDPDDPRGRYPLALQRFIERDWAGARDGLQAIVDRHPENVPAQVLLGKTLAEAGEFAALTRWAGQLPQSARQHPEVWLAMGQAALQQEQFDEAARAFWEALRRDPNHAAAMTRLAGALGALGREEGVAWCSERGRALVELRERVDMVLAWQLRSQKAALDVGRKLRELGRLWEAEAWARAATALPRDPAPEAAVVLREIQGELHSDPPMLLASHDVSRRMDLSDYPLPRWEWGESPTDPEAVSLADSARRGERAAGPLRLEDEASRRGLRFQYDNGADPRVPGMWIYQSNGGGAAVIDFDGDGWPDLYLSSAGGEPLEVEGSQPNRLFRNVGGDFVDVTEQAGVGDRGFGQGMAACDYNDDGFPDLLVGNIGENRLLRNNGDGTFTDVTAEAGLGGSFWTSCIAVADLDGDGIPDLFEVNYVAGEAPYRQRCSSSIPGSYRACAPITFPAQTDRIFRGRGDGTFEEVTERWQADGAVGRGLGLLIARMTGGDDLEVFIANDMSANHFWSPRRSPAGDFLLTESAVVRGLAFDGQARAQAGMGVAFGDADGDGDFDLFVTNFSQEHNTFYQQVRPGVWEDRSSAVGLYDPSLQYLGFGTQFLDLNADGRLELIVINGHVDDLTHEGEMFAMPPQLFRQHGGRWIEVPAREVGTYFQQTHLGRSLVTLDATRDGRPDALVTHLHAPVALLINQTPQAGNWLALDLRGTAASREAIGAIVRVQSEGRWQTSQITAGDGYQGSNQRRVFFGLGQATQVDRMEVHWPGGEIATFDTLEANGEYLVIEGRAAILPRAAPDA